jgi:hypothetical protein
MPIAARAHRLHGVAASPGAIIVTRGSTPNLTFNATTGGKHMTKKLRTVFALILGLSSFASLAGECTGCRIKSIGAGPYYDSICSSSMCVFLALDQVVSNRPSCSGNSYWHFALDISTGSGKATYALLLAAYAAGESLNVAGSNACSLSTSGVVENLYYVNHAD